MMNTFMVIVKIAPSYMQVRDSLLENRSVLLVHFKKAFPALSLYLDTHLTEELLTGYCFVLKVTTVFPIPTQVK